MFNDFSAMQLSKQRHIELMQEAEADRASKPGIPDRFERRSVTRLVRRLRRR